jgi:hypothetical protein
MPRFCTALEEGQPCATRALPGQRFCYGHHPKPPAVHQCEYFNQNGQRCRCSTLRGQSHCFSHSPRNRRANRPATPIIPRTRSQKARARWLIFKNLPQWQMGLLEHLPPQ